MKDPPSLMDISAMIAEDGFDRARVRTWKPQESDRSSFGYDCPTLFNLYKPVSKSPLESASVPILALTDAH